MPRRVLAGLASGFVLVASTASCSVATSPALDAVLTATSDHAAYVLADSPEPEITLLHGGGSAVVLTGCPAPPAAIIERRAAQGWAQEATRGVYCQAIYSTALDTLDADEARRFRVGVTRTGTYRVRVLIGPDPGVPQRTVLSNEFDVQ